MKILKHSFVLLLFSTTLIISGKAQTYDQIEKLIKKEGIKSEKDLQEELKKQNLTEDDARRLAEQYGLDYDTFLKTYILDSGTSNQLPKISNNKNQPDSIVKQKNKPLNSSKITSQETKQENNLHTEIPTKEEGLEYFGYRLFKNIPTAFEPSDIGPIDPGYMVGPGDNLRLSVWGATEFQYELTVDPQGNIFIPTAGQFFVSGTTYESLQNKLTNYLSKFYEGLTSEPPTIFLDISLTKLKPIKIFVTGEIAQPGGYNISSFATVFNALYAVGGPLPSGSLREIRVIRNNKILTTVDIYDYLLKGQLLGDVRLQNNDMVFIPPRKKTVTIKGEVFRPAIYELKSEENLQQLIQFSGGLNATAFTGRAQINRIIPFDKRINNQVDREIVDVDLSPIIDNSSDFSLYDKDTITVFPILNKLENFVTIEGSVYRPGTYEYNNVNTLKNLVEKAKGLLPETYYGKADIIRTNPDESREFLSIDLSKVMEDRAGCDLFLQPRDSVKIYSIYDLVDKKYVSISGYVKHNIILPYADSLTLYDMIFRAGGLQDPVFRGKALTTRGDLIRINPDELTTRIIPFDLEKVLKDRSSKIILQPGDKIYIYSADVEKVLEKYVTIEGEVKHPGKYMLSTNMTPMDLILQAGGFNEQSLRSEVYVSRIKPSGYSGNKISESFKVQLPLFFNKSLHDNSEPAESEFILQYKDVVVVRKNPNYTEQRVVKISGEVNYPGIYVLERKTENLFELMNKAGGPTNEAFLFGAIFTRDSNRVIIDLEKLLKKGESEQDIILKDKDEIFVPKIPNTVLVTGEVNNPGLYKFIAGRNVKDYLNNAGGETDSSNFILYKKANGETQKVGFGWFSGNPEVFDGSVITVTKQPYEPPSNSAFDIAATVKDIFAIVVSAVTIIVLAQQIK